MAATDAPLRCSVLLHRVWHRAARGPAVVAAVAGGWRDRGTRSLCQGAFAGRLAPAAGTLPRNRAEVRLRTRDREAIGGPGRARARKSAGVMPPRRVSPARGDRIR